MVHQGRVVPGPVNRGEQDRDGVREFSFIQQEHGRYHHDCIGRLRLYSCRGKVKMLYGLEMGLLSP
jgi:hypothetical protein